MSLRLRFAALAGAAVLCSAAALREFAVWRSDFAARNRTPDGLREALVYTPADAAKWRQLGILLLAQKEDSAPAFRRAVALNPLETDALLGLAIDAESHRDPVAAESLYVRAARSSRRFKPTFALAAFYARAGKRADFWRTATTAANIDQADIGRMVRLAVAAGADPDDIPALLNLRNEHALATYLEIAMAENRPRPLAAAALRLPATPEYQPALVRACDRLLDAGSAGLAVAVWNHSRAFGKLDVAAGRSLTNTGFAPSAVRGFNWRRSAPPGTHFQPVAEGLRIELTGDQPERALLLEQIVPVAARRNYRFSVRSGAAGLSSTAGLAWAAMCTPSREVLGSVSIPAPPEHTASLVFSPPAGCELVRVMLLYSRQPGTVRAAGTLDLLSAQLELRP